MKFNVSKRLNQRGFVHHVIPIVAFIALFAVVGAYFFLRSSLAATVTFYEYKSAENSAYCITNASGVAKMLACSASSHVTKTAVGGNIPAFTLKMNGQCMTYQSTGKAVFTACANHTTQWWQNYNGSIENYAETGANYCMGAGGPSGQIVKYSACNGPADKWNYVKVTSTTSTSPPSSGGGGQTSITSFSGVSNPLCYKNLYTTANVKTAYYCVAALQEMLNTMKPYDGFKTTLGVDGQYGTNTYNAVHAYQAYEKISADGKTGSQTWHYMCWSIWNRRKDSGNKAWAYAGCNSPASEHSTPAGKTNLR